MNRDEQYTHIIQELDRLSKENEALKQEIAALKIADETAVESLGQIESDMVNLNDRITALEPTPAQPE